MEKFDKLLDEREITIPIDPIEIFDNLDKEIGKEYLRKPQESVLKEWYKKHQTQKDTIIKLHTGQGKTLIGLLILQSSINEEKGPAIYMRARARRVQQIVYEAGVAAGIPLVGEKMIHPHHFRHSHCVAWVRANPTLEGLRKLQQRVGHSSITTTAHYLQFAFEEQREEVEKVLGEVIA